MTRGGRRAWGAIAPLLAGVACALGATTAGAQAPRLEVDVSGTRIQYDTLAALNAPSVAGLAEWQRASVFARLAASVTGFENAGWSMQGQGDLAGWLSPMGPAHPLRLELGGAVGGARHSRDFDSYLARGDARVHLRGRQYGGWAGASLAGARNSFDSAAVTGWVPSGGVWAQGAYLRASLSYLGTRVDGDSYPEGNLSVSLSRGRADLTVYGGIRDSPFEGVEGERWAGASAAFWVNSNTAAVLSGGRYSSDVLQGLPGGEFVSLGVRFTPRRVRPVPFSARAPIVYTADEARLGSIGFVVPDATRVEIAGDWNGWVPEVLTRDASGRWIVPAGIEPGVHRFNLRVDGASWIVPEGVPSTDDGYGGLVGLLLISATP